MSNQDKSEIKLIAKKSLGQHFLRSEKALNDIVNTIGNSDSKKPVFEIGPGEGVLTQKLLEKGYIVYVIEIDQRSIELLKDKFKSELKTKQLNIIEKDCLEVNYNKIVGGREYFLVGNIPYYITGAIFRHSFEQDKLPQVVTFLVQKEVAQRIVAHDKKESLLSVSVKIFTKNNSNVKIVDIVKRGSFVPPPKVDSAIITIQNVINPFIPISIPSPSGKGAQEIFFKILKASFSHKRKFLFSNLKTDLEKDMYEKYIEKLKEIILKNYSEKIRAEDISIDTWKEIVGII